MLQDGVAQSTVEGPVRERHRFERADDVARIRRGDIVVRNLRNRIRQQVRAYVTTTGPRIEQVTRKGLNNRIEFLFKGLDVDRTDTHRGGFHATPPSDY